MDSALFHTLLYRTESERSTLSVSNIDFTEPHHADRAELLKDILAFANAWRDTDAYILIGVEEVRGTKANVVGDSPSVSTTVMFSSS